MKRGPYYKDRREVFERAVELRKQGFGLRAVQKRLPKIIPLKTLQNWFRGMPIDIKTAHRKAIEEAMSQRTPTSKPAIRKRLIDKRGRICECCGLSEWLGRPITLEVDHIDGDNMNNLDSNLRLLCPNCHSYTPYWRRRKSADVAQSVEALALEARG